MEKKDLMDEVIAARKKLHLSAWSFSRLISKEEWLLRNDVQYFVKKYNLEKDIEHIVNFVWSNGCTND